VCTGEFVLDDVECGRFAALDDACDRGVDHAFAFALEHRLGDAFLLDARERA